MGVYYHRRQEEQGLKLVVDISEKIARNPALLVWTVTVVKSLGFMFWTAACLKLFWKIIGFNGHTMVSS